LTAILLDTGPIVAFLRADDVHHEWAVDVLGQVAPPLLTCEPVLSEALFLVRRHAGGAQRVLELVRRGLVKIDFRLADELDAVDRLIRKYGAQAMDLSDACLVRMAERQRDCVVLSVDHQFRDVYRRNGRQAIPTILPAHPRRRRG
jgi:predicted nucleic acid-binding protein